MDVCGALWTISGGGGSRTANSKPLADNDLRIVAAEIRTPRCTPTLGLIPSLGRALVANALSSNDFAGHSLGRLVRRATAADAASRFQLPWSSTSSRGRRSNQRDQVPIARPDTNVTRSLTVFPPRTSTMRLPCRTEPIHSSWHLCRPRWSSQGRLVGPGGVCCISRP